MDWLLGHTASGAKGLLLALHCGRLGGYMLSGIKLGPFYKYFQWTEVSFLKASLNGFLGVNAFLQ